VRFARVKGRLQLQNYLGAIVHLGEKHGIWKGHDHSEHGDQLPNIAPSESASAADTQKQTGEDGLMVVMAADASPEDYIGEDNIPSSVKSGDRSPGDSSGTGHNIEATTGAASTASKRRFAVSNPDPGQVHDSTARRVKLSHPVAASTFDQVVVQPRPPDVPAHTESVLHTSCITSMEESSIPVAVLNSPVSSDVGQSDSPAHEVNWQSAAETIMNQLTAVLRDERVKEHQKWALEWAQREEVYIKAYDDLWNLHHQAEARWTTEREELMVHWDSERDALMSEIRQLNSGCDRDDLYCQRLSRYATECASRISEIHLKAQGLREWLQEKLQQEMDAIEAEYAEKMDAEVRMFQ
jgi:hypothetical protein